MEKVPGGLTELGLKAPFWTAVSENWTEIKEMIEKGGGDNTNAAAPVISVQPQDSS
jgi:hypothetical protein